MAAENGVTFYEYGACSTCRKARAWLGAKGVAFRAVPIVERPPSREALEALVARSGLPARKWLNTSGQSYRALVASLGKEAALALGDDDLIGRMAADGKLIKRPVLVARDRVLVGFREDEYAALAPARERGRGAG
ncbi:MAG TPA: Spx/MgsR family RNA polymerase-binding regulatory protein [Polyangiaceae bacterium]|nr:Spx/MgsR family RNA polymerase-binding regulatory protein [Polyangiaceae bacterium]